MGWCYTPVGTCRDHFLSDVFDGDVFSLKAIDIIVYCDFIRRFSQRAVSKITATVHQLTGFRDSDFAGEKKIFKKNTTRETK